MHDLTHFIPLRIIKIAYYCKQNVDFLFSNNCLQREQTNRNLNNYENTSRMQAIKHDIDAHTYFFLQIATVFYEKIGDIGIGHNR